MTFNCKADELLIRIFERHFADPVAAFLRLEGHLKLILLPFDLKAQIREVQFPPQPIVPNGLRSFIYYYLPNSGWGSGRQLPADPLDPNFVTVTDGISLNLGCPVRLLRALDVLASLRPEDQKEVRDGLTNPAQHFATVEELLWLTYWRSPSDLRRGGLLPGASGNVDWALKCSGFPIYLESKFRPSDWPRLSDHGTFTPMEGSFLGKAVHKFPNPPHESPSTAEHLRWVDAQANDKGVELPRGLVGQHNRPPSWALVEVLDIAQHVATGDNPGRKLSSAERKMKTVATRRAENLLERYSAAVEEIKTMPGFLNGTAPAAVARDRKILLGSWEPPKTNW